MAWAILLKLECSVASIYEVMWNAAYHPESCPMSSYVKMKFPGKPGKPDVELHWMDGGIRPPRPDEAGRRRKNGRIGRRSDHHRHKG
ncbi:hypothetical protein ACQ86N_20635 [Puia sp. P3]|uniref:hypothetical protein n=1 Tax=Puia sp. P3 TaxID=3423952 RepID=UPI003D670D2C